MIIVYARFILQINSIIIKTAIASARHALRLLSNVIQNYDEIEKICVSIPANSLRYLKIVAHFKHIIALLQQSKSILPFISADFRSYYFAGEILWGFFQIHF